MARRLYIQVGMIMVVGALATSAAYADSSTEGSVSSGTTLSQTGGSTVDVSGGGSVEVSNSTHSSQSVDGGQSGSSSNDSFGSGNGSSGAVFQSGDGTQSPSDQSGTASPANPAVTSDSGSAGLSSTIGHVPNNASSLALGSPAVYRVTAAMRQAVFQRQADIQQATLEAPVSALVPLPATPSIPTTASDFLGKLRNLLTSSTLPTPETATGPPISLPNLSITPSAGLALMVALVLLTSLLLLDFYTARLRRSGYSVAARSDVGAAILTFATPPKMGFIGSFAT